MTGAAGAVEQGGAGRGGARIGGEGIVHNICGLRRALRRAEAAETAQASFLLRCLGVAAFAAMNIMMLSIPVWSGTTGDMIPEQRDFFHWLSTLIAAGCEMGFFAKYSETAGAHVIDYLVRDPDNPSSVLAALETARQNARLVRTAITVDMWDSLNDTWRVIAS